MQKIFKKIQDNKVYRRVAIALILLGLSLAVTGITLALSSAKLNPELYESYLNSLSLIVMNLLPILLLMSIIYVISNRLWLSFSITSLLFVVLGIVNKLKLTYRDDPLVFLDFKLAGESIQMASRYDISISFNWIAIIVGLIVFSFILKKFFDFKIESKKIRMGATMGLIVIGVFISSGFYFDQDLYKSIGDEDVINGFIESEIYQSKGFVYPLVYSIESSISRPFEGYEKEQAKENLNNYTYSDIDEDKKVNVVSIMLEAYNDFSKFESVEVSPETYEYFHKLQDESLSGRIVTNVFAGGTINTERGFLTGYHHHPQYNELTNSFAWYFKEQGYNTEAMHPITGSFYNRRNSNEYIGFDNFDYYENKYEAVQEEPLMDMKFFDFIIEGYKESVAEDKAYFHFSVTYQNHGPYSDTKYDEEEFLIKKPEYNESDYNIANNYLRGIHGTNLALEKLVDTFEESDEPVVLVLFGDHNPWLGTDNSAYKMMDIDMDMGTVEGFENYYETPYIIWGNSAAKEVLGKDFTEEGPTISPNYLMAELFDYVGWEGNEYMQYISNLKEEIPVNNETYFKTQDEFIKADELPEDIEEIWNDFRHTEYYTKTNFSREKETN